MEIQVISVKRKKKIYCEGDQRLEQVAEEDCGLSVLEDIKNPTGHVPGQLALAGCGVEL